jgi:(p)ppGpp synthase/HD superfamily hydrolase
MAWADRLRPVYRAGFFALIPWLCYAGHARGAYMLTTNYDLIQLAWGFASRKHNGQLYPGSEKLPYITHIGSVLLELLPALQENASLDAETAMCCAILHDTMEDTHTTIQEIAEQFGEKVAAGIHALTKDKSLKGEEATRDSLERIKEQPLEIWAVKLADRAANLRTPPDHWGSDKRLAYAIEGQLILDALGEASPAIAKTLAARIEAWKRDSQDAKSPAPDLQRKNRKRGL